MLKRSIVTIALSSLLLSVSAVSYAATTPTASTTPQEMTCKEFIDLNPKTFTPVLYWVANKDTHYKKGDYVDLQETEVVLVPKVIELCKKTPEKKLTDMKQEMHSLVKAHQQ